MAINKIKVGNVEHELHAVRATSDGNGDNIVNTYETKTAASSKLATAKSYADTHLATAKSYTDTKVAGIVDSAPETLNTLNELAAALGDDSNFATTVTTLIGSKVPLAGGTMTGTLIAPLFKSDNSAASLKISDSNEINFGSNANYIYLGYDNRTDSSGIIDTYYFGTHSGPEGAKNGNIECGSLKTGRTVTVGNAATLQYDSTNECLNFVFS